MIGGVVVVVAVVDNVVNSVVVKIVVVVSVVDGVGGSVVTRNIMINSN